MSKTVKESIKVDTLSGSRSFNRYEFQLSQTLHMAIELYDTLNFLFILDHYDDITLFDMDTDPLAVSYYQVKTSKNKITIDSAIKNGWFAKLYEQLDKHSEWIVKELGLITNLPMHVKFTLSDDDVSLHELPKKHRNEELNSDRTLLANLHESVQDKIKSDIADKCGLMKSNVDLSKFFHMRTTFTIENHSDLAEKEMGDFLHGKYPNITMDTVKGIYSSMICLLTQKQQYENLSEDASFESVCKYKGLAKKEFHQVIEHAIMLSIPTFDDVFKYSKVDKKMESSLSLPYVKIMSDSNNKNDKSFPKLFSLTLETIKNTLFIDGETGWDYAKRVANSVRMNAPVLCIPYDQNYVEVLTVCLMINESRRRS